MPAERTNRNSAIDGATRKARARHPRVGLLRVALLRGIATPATASTTSDARCDHDQPSWAEHYRRRSLPLA
jgi:hypothetical protein